MKLPESLLISPCNPIGINKTLKSVVNGYIHNTSCIKMYNDLLNEIRNYNNLVGEQSDRTITK